MGCTWQVIQHIDVHHSDECRVKFMSEVTIYDPSMLLWIYESVCDKRNSLRKWAYSMKGITSKDHKLLVQGKWFSQIPVMFTEGIHDVYLFKENVNMVKGFKNLQQMVCCQYLISLPGPILTLLSSWII